MIMIRPLTTVFALAIALASPLPGAVHTMKSNEINLFRIIARDGGQQRASLKLDPILCQVARAQVTDMIKRGYAGHVSPDGIGPNLLARKAGYRFPSYYSDSKDANSIESFAMTTENPSTALGEWKRHAPDRVHLLGELPFYRDQTRCGIGIVTSSKAPFYHYIVFISAPPNLSSLRHVVLKDPRGRIITTTGGTSAQALLYKSLSGTRSDTVPQ